MAIFGRMQFRFKRSLLPVILTCTLLSSCRQDVASEMHRSQLPADFIEFYTLFHHDTAYQMEHIVFPLPGLKMILNESDSTAGKDYWTKQGWVPHRKMKSSDQFIRSYDILEETMIVETIRERDGINAMQRRFARMSDGWHLIYYMEMQPARPPE